MKKLEVISASKDGITSYKVGEGKFSRMLYDRIEKTDKVRVTSIKTAYRDLNKEQQKTYKEVVYGLSSFHPEDVQSMSQRKRKSVLAKFYQAQRIITIYKNRKTNEIVRQMMEQWFPKSKLAKEFASKKYDTLDLPNHVSFKDLKMEKYDIAEILVKESVLPENFFSL
jgi:hypothetical protein